MSLNVGVSMCKDVYYANLHKKREHFSYALDNERIKTKDKTRQVLHH